MRLAASLAGLALSATVVSTAGCGRLFFFPMQPLQLSPDRIGLVYEDVTIRAEDGVRLHGWFLPARAGGGPARGTVLFLHGNAENISTHIGAVSWLPAEGFDVLLFDYRGYGRSEGSPSIAGVHRDAAAALAAVAARADVDPRRLIVFGQSLGGAVAVVTVARFRTEIPVAALVVDSAFSDYRGIVREKAAALWLTWPLQWPMALTVSAEPTPLSAVRELGDVPLLLVHGEADRTIPVHHSHVLHRAAAGNATLWTVPAADHGRALESLATRKRLVDWLQAALARRAAEPSTGDP